MVSAMSGHQPVWTSVVTLSHTADGHKLGWMEWTVYLVHLLTDSLFNMYFCVCQRVWCVYVHVHCTFN